MYSKTLLLSSLLGIMTFFRGTMALPASSTTSLIPESATTFGESVQATPTTAVELANTSNTTSASLESDSNDSESQIVKRSKPKGEKGWIQFYGNERCENPPTSKEIKQQRYGMDPCCKIDKIYEESVNASYIWIRWGTGDLKMTHLAWFNSTLECDYPHSYGGNFTNYGDSVPGICVERPKGIDSVIGVYT